MPIPSFAEVDTTPVDGAALWNAVFHVEPAASTEHAGTSIRPAIRPWYDQDGADGMRLRSNA